MSTPSAASPSPAPPAAPDPAPLKATPLRAAHLRAGGRLVGFGGWEMPVAYPAGILAEHRAVRTAAGVFDISHMGQLVVGGPGARAWLDGVFTNNLARIGAGQSQYGFLLNERGGVIDDLIIYQTAPASFLLVVNAAKADEDVAWLRARLPAGAGTESGAGDDGAGGGGEGEGGRVTWRDHRADRAALAVQGPRTPEILAAFFGPEVAAALPARHGALLSPVDRAGVPFTLSRTGYTGEEGFEWFFPAAAAEQVWEELLAVGAPFGLVPCGLGARDSLRLEVCYPLNGADLSPERTPLEAGLGAFVDLKDKADFVGRDALRRQQQEGVKERLAAFRMTEKGPPPRAHYPLFHDGRQVGEAASANLSPSLEVGIGLAYLPAALARPGQTLEIGVRDRRYGVRVEKKPLYRRG